MTADREEGESLRDELESRIDELRVEGADPFEVTMAFSHAMDYARRVAFCPECDHKLGEFSSWAQVTCPGCGVNVIVQPDGNFTEVTREDRYGL